MKSENIQLWAYRTFPHRVRKEHRIFPGRIIEFKLQDCADTAKSVSYRYPDRMDWTKSFTSYGKINKEVTHKGSCIEVILDHRSFDDALRIIQTFHNGHYKTPCDYSTAERVTWEEVEAELKKEEEEKEEQKKRAIERKQKREKESAELDRISGLLQSDVPVSKKIQDAADALVAAAIELKETEGTDPPLALAVISAQAIHKLGEVMDKEKEGKDEV